MLLTVIAVATLLVAVVGATFAYFSLSVSSDNKTTTANVQTGKIPTIKLDNKNEKLYLKVSAEDMAKANENSAYFAQTSDCPDASSCNTKGTSQDAESKYSDIYTLSIENGDEDAEYTCSGTLKVTATSAQWTEVGSSLQSGELTIGIKDYDDEGSSQTLDMVALKESEYSQDYSISYKITGNQSKTIKAYLMLENTEKVQDYLAGKTFDIKISAEDVTCTPTKTA